MTQIVGILNITPDSFSHKNEAPLSPEEQIKKLIETGAEIIDIGAESTRPNAETITPEEEQRRLLPILKLVQEYKSAGSPPLFSIDTRNPETARLALQYGVDWLNDVTGFNHPAMIAVAKEYDATCVFMHSLTVPADPNIVFPEDADVVHEVYVWAEKKIATLRAAGLDKLIFDCGIGFGKTAEQSWQLIQNIERFASLDVPILVGHSRKSFLTLFTDKPAHERDLETHRISRLLAEKKVDYIRVHTPKPL